MIDSIFRITYHWLCGSMSTQAIPLKEFMDEKWEYFAGFENQTEKLLTEISRELPPQCYDEMRVELLEFMLLSGINGKISINTVLDSNIIVGDALRVASGKKSRTERILSSPYANYSAPAEIKDEVERNIKKNLQGDSRLDSALAHAKNLLSNVKIISKLSESTLDSAKRILSNHLKDAPFLATYFQLDADAIVSKEVGTFDKPGICHWTLSEAVEVIVTYESGTLALVIAGSVIEAMLNAFVKIITLFLRALEEAIHVIVDILSSIARGTIDFIAKLPDWAKAVLLIGGAAIIIGLIFHEGFRNWLTGGIEKMGKSISVYITKIVQVLKGMWNAFKDLLILIWNIALPITSAAVIVGGVLIRRVLKLMEIAVKLSERNSKRPTSS